MIALLAALALAAPSGTEIRAWSDSGIELRPDLYGETGLRAAERLGLQAELSEGWSLRADGAVRLRQSPLDDLHLDPYRLGLAHTGSRLSAQLGRHVRLDPRGLQRLDGGSLHGGAGSAVETQVWAGRLWHPDPWSTGLVDGLGQPGDTGVVGGQLTFRPVIDGRPSPLTHVSVGAEGRWSSHGLGLRAHLAAATASPRGHSASTLVEVDPVDEALRAGLRGTLAAGRAVDVDADLRWEGLSPASAPDGANTPIDWLSPRGYGVANLGARARAGRVGLALQGGPTLRRDGATGGLGRASLSWFGDGPRASLFASAAGVGRSWFGGGGGAVGYARHGLEADADLGVYRFTGLDGGAAAVWEGRVQGRLPVIEGSRSVQLALQGAAGTDRQLARWVRGGLAVHAQLGRAP